MNMKSRTKWILTLSDCRGVLFGMKPNDVFAQAAGNDHATAVFSGGCFWGVDAVFKHVKGVDKVVSGYAGGAANTAQYEMVSTGTTGHAESVQVTYDPSKVCTTICLKVFFFVAHDPTELNRQGPDSGTQYRSSIFYANDAQKKMADDYIAQLDQKHAFSETDRDQSSSTNGLLSGRRLSSELPGAASRSALHRFQRFAEAGAVSENLAGAVPAAARATGREVDQPAAARRSSILRISSARERA